MMQRQWPEWKIHLISARHGRALREEPLIRLFHQIFQNWTIRAGYSHLWACEACTQSRPLALSCRKLTTQCPQGPVSASTKYDKGSSTKGRQAQGRSRCCGEEAAHRQRPGHGTGQRNEVSHLSLCRTQLAVVPTPLANQKGVWTTEFPIPGPANR